MDLILSLETSTTVCSVALSEDGHLLALREINEGYSHSENITVFIDEVFREAGHTMNELAAVAVSSGPGSYTGLRIGVSTAKGICYALDKPLIAVGTLKCMAGGFISGASADKNSTFVPMIDARRMEVYCTAFDFSLNPLEAVTAKVIDADSFSDYLDKGNVYFFGDGAAKCRSIIQHNNAIFSDKFFPSAEFVIPFAFEKFRNGEFEDLARYEPFYLKDFVAGLPKKQ